MQATPGTLPSRQGDIDGFRRQLRLNGLLFQNGFFLLDGVLNLLPGGIDPGTDSGTLFAGQTTQGF